MNKLLKDISHDIKIIIKDIKTQLHKNPFVKFLFVLLILVVYFVFSIQKFGLKDGFLVSLLSWTFFVLSTPIADAGFLLDFPVRLFTGLRMLYSEGIVWTIAITSNLLVFFFKPEIYTKTELLSLLYHILSKPFPFWIIILLSAGGTFLSLLFGDELMDISLDHKKEASHKQKHKKKYILILTVTVFVLILIIYDYLLKQLGVHIPLIG